MNLAAFAAEMGITSAERLADIGCGDGAVLADLVDRLAPRTAMGIDVEVTAENPFTCVRADAARLALRSRSFDVVTTSALLHHLADPGAAIAEMARIVSPGGWLLIAEGDRLTDEDFRQMNRELRTAGLAEERHGGFTAAELQEWVVAAGLTVERVSTGGVATFATPPFVSRTFRSRRQLVAATRAVRS